MRQNIKKWAFGLTSSVLSTLAFASAYGYADFRGASNDIVSWIQDIFGPILAVLLGVDQFNQYLFARVLLAVLLFMVIYSVIKKVRTFKDHSTIATLVALIVSLLGTRTLSESQFIVGILIPYSTVALALAVALPVLIFFYFVHESGMGAAGRRLMWVLFGVIFVSLWVSRLSDTTGVMNWIYLLGIIITAAFFAFDSKIHYYFEYGKFKNRLGDINTDAYTKLLIDIKDFKKAHGENPNDYPGPIYERWLRLEDAEKVMRKKLSL